MGWFLPLWLASASAAPANLQLAYEGTSFALEDDAVREVLLRCTPSGSVFANDRPIPPPATDHGAILAVVGTTGVHVSTEGLAAGSCVREGIRALVGPSREPGSAIGIRVASSMRTARLMRGRLYEARSVEPNEELSAIDGAVIAVWDQPSLLGVLVGPALSKCAGSVSSVSETRFRMQGYSVSLASPAHAKAQACLNQRLAAMRFDDSMDAMVAEGTLVFAPMRFAYKTAAFAPTDELKDTLTAATRHCPEPLTPTLSIDFAFSGGKAQVTRMHTGRTEGPVPDGFEACLVGRLGGLPDGKGGLYYTYQ